MVDGKAALLLGGVLAASGWISLPVLLVIAALAAVLAAGWWVSRRVRPWSRQAWPAVLEQDGLALTVGALVAGASTFVFAALGEGALEGGELTSADRPVLDWFVAHRSGGATAVLRLASDLGSTAVLPVLGLAVAGAVARHTRSWRPVVFMAIVATGSSLLTVAAETLVGRAGPPAATALVGANGFAFPSGPALDTAAIVGACAVLLWTYRRARIWSTGSAIVVVLLVGVSRLYLGVHWLTDVVAGYALGVGWLAALTTAFHVTRPARIRPAPEVRVPSYG